MLPTVNLDDQQPFEAEKVDNITSERYRLTEAHTVQSLAAQACPKCSLSFGAILA